jgi:hypothetical protein
MVNSNFKRDAAISINISDPDSDQTNSINDIIELDNKLFTFSENIISEILLAESIDPENRAPNTRHGYQIIYKIGTKQSYVARTIIQSKEILDSVLLRNNLDKKFILNHIWKCTKYLLNCENLQYMIYTQVLELIKECDSIIQEHKNNTYIPSLPQVDNLEQLVDSYFSNAKKFLTNTYELLHIFYESPNFKENFNSYLEWIHSNRKENIEIINILEQDKNWIRLIAECRNAIQHPDEDFRFSIQNFTLEPDNKFSSPCWKYDLRKRGGDVQQNFSDIIVDMDIQLSNMMTFFEEIFLVCIKDNWNKKYKFKLYKKSEKDINDQCPTLYYINLNMDS